MNNGKIKNILTTIKKTRWPYLMLGLIIIIGGIAIYLWFNDNSIEKLEPKLPSISIGCNRVIWEDTKLKVEASTQNIKNPKFQWLIDNKSAGNDQFLEHEFGLGKYKISLNVLFDKNNNKNNKSGTLKDNISVLAINSTNGMLVKDSQASKNEWAFQTLYNKKKMGVDGVEIYIDSFPKIIVNNCGYISVPLFAGDHTWKAQYRGNILASGNFTLKEVKEIKLSKIDIDKNYKVGDTVEGKIIVKNTGTVTMKGFDIKTVAVNNKYKWMGDIAKREYYDKYDVQLNPGDKYEIIIRVSIPKEVKGIAPTGKYSLTINLLSNDKVVDTKIVNTDVRD